jgi:hypothetical protein
MKILVEDMLRSDLSDVDECDGMREFGAGHDIVKGKELLAMQLPKCVSAGIVMSNFMCRKLRAIDVYYHGPDCRESALSR